MSKIQKLIDLEYPLSFIASLLNGATPYTRLSDLEYIPKKTDNTDYVIECTLKFISEEERNCVKALFKDKLKRKEICELYHITESRLRTIIRSSYNKLSRKIMLMNVIKDNIEISHNYLTLANYMRIKKLDILNVDIDHLDLSPIICDLLKQIDVYYVRDLISLLTEDPYGFKFHKRLGKHNIDTIISKMNDIGFKITEEGKGRKVKYIIERIGDEL